MVKDEQTRAREAGKSARGAGGGSGRGMLYAYPLSIYALIVLPVSGRSGAPQRGLLFVPLLFFFL